MSDQTVSEFFDKFDTFKRAGNSVIIHPALPFDFLEVTPEFVSELKTALQLKLTMIDAKIETADPITKFAVMILKDAF